MAKPHLVTAVINPKGEGDELKLSAYFDEGQEMVIIELENKEIFRMDYENFDEWTNLVKEQKV